MTSPLAIHGGRPVIDRPAPHVTWPPVDSRSALAVVSQLFCRVSIPDRSGVVAELEDRLAGYFGVRHAVLTSSGTAALHSAYAALDLRDGDEVLVPAYNFHATATPLLQLRAKPVLVDCDDTGNLDPTATEAAVTTRTAAIAVTHLWGVPANIEPLVELADRHGIALVEDGSHAHGATVGGRKVGAFGRVSAFSMNGPKPLSAGEGGFVLTDDDEIYYRVLLHGQYNQRCRSEIPAAHPLAPYSVTGAGLKLHIHPLAAALASDQLDHLDKRLDGRRRIATRMLGRLRSCRGSLCPTCPPDCSRAGTPSRSATTRMTSIGSLSTPVAALQAEGCLDLDRPGSTRPMNEHALLQDPFPLFPALPESWPHYRPGQFPNAERLHGATLKLPVPHEDEDLARSYVRAFEKVLSNRHHLWKDHAHATH